MKAILYPATVLIIISSCKSKSAEKTTDVNKDTVTAVLPADTTNDASLVSKSESLKASIETMAPSLHRQEVILKNSKANESIRQEWMKMDVYTDSGGLVRKIRLYPYKGISERSEEFYYDNERMFFVYISDHGVNTENNDEGKPGKEFHFSGNRLVKYDDKSGDKEINPGEEKKMYESSLPIEAEEFLQLAKNKD